MYFIAEMKDVRPSPDGSYDTKDVVEAINSTAEVLFHSFGYPWLKKPSRPEQTLSYYCTPHGMKEKMILSLALFFHINNAEDILKLEQALAAKPAIPSALYYDEYEKLIARFPGVDTPIE